MVYDGLEFALHILLDIKIDLYNSKSADSHESTTIAESNIGLHYLPRHSFKDF